MAIKIYSFFQVKSSLVTIIFLLASLSLTAQKPGSFTDPREGKTYKTVTIGAQTWMAENMNYVTGEGSWCYDEENSYCDTYGRLYTWHAALEACPEGWHVPGAEEWEQLFNYLGGIDVAGQKLKATNGWKNSDTKGTGSSVFSALPGGARNYGAVCVRAGTHGYYWSATELGGGAWYFELSYNNAIVNKYASNYKGPGFSVRCLQDN